MLKGMVVASFKEPPSYLSVRAEKTGHDTPAEIQTKHAFVMKVVSLGYHWLLHELSQKIYRGRSVKNHL